MHGVRYRAERQPIATVRSHLQHHVWHAAIAARAARTSRASRAWGFVCEKQEIVCATPCDGSHCASGSGESWADGILTVAAVAAGSQQLPANRTGVAKWSDRQPTLGRALRTTMGRALRPAFALLIEEACAVGGQPLVGFPEDDGAALHQPFLRDGARGGRKGRVGNGNVECTGCRRMSHASWFSELGL